MATELNAELFSGEAGSAVTVYRFVVRAADGQYDHVAVAQSEMDGVAAESQANVGGSLPIAAMKGGSILKVEAGAAVSALATVGSDNVGRAITAVSGAGNWEAGKALDAAAGAGEIIRVQILKDRDQA